MSTLVLADGVRGLEECPTPRLPVVPIRNRPGVFVGFALFRRADPSPQFETHYLRLILYNHVLCKSLPNYLKGVTTSNVFWYCQHITNASI